MSRTTISGSRLLALSVVALVSIAALAPAQAVPITTSSAAARAEFEQGRARLFNADLPGARVHFDAALAQDPEFGLAHMYRAIASARSEREAFMQKAAKAAVSDGERQIIEAYAASLAGKPEAGIAILDGLVQKFPDDACLLYNRGYECYSTKRFDAAVASFQKAIDIDPDFAGAYNMLGYAAMEQGDDATAERAFREYCRLAPAEANPHDSIGEFYMLRGRLEEAEQHFHKALALDANFEASRQNLARIGIQRANQRFVEAVANKSADALAALYTNNGQLLPPNEAAVTGRAAIRDYWAGFIASGVEAIGIHSVEIFFGQDTATEIGNWTITVEGKVVDSGRATIVWAKVGDSWLMHRDMWSSDRAPASGGDPAKK